LRYIPRTYSFRVQNQRSENAHFASTFDCLAEATIHQQIYHYAIAADRQTNNSPTGLISDGETARSAAIDPGIRRTAEVQSARSTHLAGKTILYFGIGQRLGSSSNFVKTSVKRFLSNVQYIGL